MKLRVGKTQVEFNVLMVAIAVFAGYMWYTGKLKMPELPLPSGNDNDEEPSLLREKPQPDLSQFCTEPRPGENWVCLPAYRFADPTTPTYVAIPYKWYPPGSTMDDVPCIGCT